MLIVLININKFLLFDDKLHTRKHANFLKKTASVYLMQIIQMTTFDNKKDIKQKLSFYQSTVFGFPFLLHDARDKYSCSMQNLPIDQSSYSHMSFSFQSQKITLSDRCIFTLKLTHQMNLDAAMHINGTKEFDLVFYEMQHWKRKKMKQHQQLRQSKIYRDLCSHWPIMARCTLLIIGQWEHTILPLDYE